MSDERRRVAEMLAGSGPSQFEGLGLSPEVQARLDERAARTMGILSFALGGAGRIGQAAATGMSMARRPQKDWVQELTNARNENPYNLPPASADTRLAEEAQKLRMNKFYGDGSMSTPVGGSWTGTASGAANKINQAITDPANAAGWAGANGIADAMAQADNPPAYPPPAPEFGPSTQDRVNASMNYGLIGSAIGKHLLKVPIAGPALAYGTVVGAPIAGVVAPPPRLHRGQYNPQMPYFPTDGDQ